MTSHQKLNVGNKIFIVFLFLVGLIFFVASIGGIAIQTCIWSGETERAKIVEWSREVGDEFVTIEFLNRYDNMRYTVTKEVDHRTVEKFKDKTEIDIRYSRFFLSTFDIVGVREYGIVLDIFNLFIGVGLSYRAGAALRGMITVEDLAG